MSTQSTSGADARDAARIVEEYEKFLKSYYRDEIGSLAQEDVSSGGLHIDWMDLYRFSGGYDGPDLAEQFRRNPQQHRDYLEEAVHSIDLPADVSLAGVHVRVHVPDNDSLTLNVGETRAEHRGEFIGLTGQISKATDVRPKAVEAAFECQRCGMLTRIPQTESSFQEPHECQGCERQGPFRLNYDQSEFINHQLIRLEQLPEQVETGQGATIDVHLEGKDIVKTAKPGDRVTVSGVYRLIEADQGDSGPAFEYFLEGHAIDKLDSDYEDIDVDEHLEEIEAIASGERGNPYELLVESIAPDIYGYPEIKLAVGLQQFGGVNGTTLNDSSERGDSHILLLGDPGTAKSMMLNRIEDVIPRSAFASGKGATAAGLTAGVESDDFGDQEYSLSAGALVRANEGVACIDEIDKVPDDVVSSLHTALEKQVVEVSKIVKGSMPARTSVLAAGNPKYGRFDQYEPMGEQIDIGPTLLSRFDLIFLLQDNPERESDQRKIDHIIEGRQTAIRYTEDEHQVTEEERAQHEAPIQPEVLRAYIAHARQTCYPSIQDAEVAQSLSERFLELRLSNPDNDAPVPVTLRKLKGLMRIAEASARVRLSDTVEMEDINRASELVRRCMKDVGIDPETGEFDADIVETGQSHSQKDRIRTVMGIIEDLQDEHDPGAPIEEVISRAGAEGISEERTEHIIEENLLRQGEAYCPGADNDHIRTF